MNSIFLTLNFQGIQCGLSLFHTTAGHVYLFLGSASTSHIQVGFRYLNGSSGLLVGSYGLSDLNIGLLRVIAHRQQIVQVLLGSVTGGDHLIQIDPGAPHVGGS